MRKNYTEGAKLLLFGFFSALIAAVIIVSVLLFRDDTLTVSQRVGIAPLGIYCDEDSYVDSVEDGVLMQRLALLESQGKTFCLRRSVTNESWGVYARWKIYAGR